MNPRRRLLLALTVSSLLALAGCGGGGGGTEDGRDAQPNPETTTFTAEDLQAIPLPAGAEPASRPEDTDDVTTQSFRLPGRTPEEALNHFQTVLPGEGWELADAPSPYGTQGYRGEWVRDGTVLEISAGPFMQAGSETAENAVVTQFSLVLRG